MAGLLHLYADCIFGSIHHMGNNEHIPQPGWHVDEETGHLKRDTIHHMGRRCRNWDYCGRGCYLITLTLADRSRPLLGEVRRDGPPMNGREPRPPMDGQEPRPPMDGRELHPPMDGRALFTPTELGRRVEAHVWRIPEFTPEIEVLGVQCMPDHLHMVLRVSRRMAKPLGEHLRGFKIGCTKIALSAMDGRTPHSPMDGRAQGRAQGEAARGKGLFADGFVDTILFDDEAVKRGLDYMRDNPRRLVEKREHPEYFRMVRQLRIHVHGNGEDSPMDGRALDGRALCFAALGNQALLRAPSLVQVQCSRRFFAYARDSQGRILPKAPPAVCTAEFEEKCADMLAAAAHGAVLVSPCISHGEREIARRACAAGARIVALKNKGFSSLEKPSGRLFDLCADGRLLLLAPAGWPFLPGEKKMTREDACVLNRIAQLLLGTNAAKINYRGVTPAGIDKLLAEATTAIRQT